MASMGTLSPVAGVPAFPAAKDLPRARRLLQLPDQGVLAPALANHQHVHHELARITVQNSKMVRCMWTKRLVARHQRKRQCISLSEKRPHLS